MKCIQTAQKTLMNRNKKTPFDCNAMASTTYVKNGESKKLCVPAIPSWSVLAAHLQDAANTHGAIDDPPFPVNLILHEDEPTFSNERRTQPGNDGIEDINEGEDCIVPFYKNCISILLAVVLLMYFLNRFALGTGFQVLLTSALCGGFHYLVSYVIDEYRLDVCKRVEGRIMALLDLVATATKLIRVAEVKAQGGSGHCAMSVPMARMEYNRFINGQQRELQCLALRRAVVSVQKRFTAFMTSHLRDPGEEETVWKGEELLLFSIDQKAKALRQQHVPLFTEKKLRVLHLSEVKSISTKVEELASSLESRIRLHVRVQPQPERTSLACPLPSQFKFLLHQIADGLREAQTDVHRCYEEAIRSPTLSAQLQRLQAYSDELDAAMNALRSTQADVKLTLAHYDEGRCRTPPKLQPTLQPPAPSPVSQVATKPTQQSCTTSAAQPENVTLVFQETVTPLVEMPHLEQSEHMTEEAELETEFMGELVQVLKHRSTQLPPERYKSGKKLEELTLESGLLKEGPVHNRRSSNALMGDTNSSSCIHASSICKESPTLLQELQNAIRSSHVEAEG